MYIFPDMIDMALKDGEEWKSKAHRIVAQNILLCNPHITTRDELIRCGNIIQEYSEEAIKQVTILDLYKKGIPLP